MFTLLLIAILLALGTAKDVEVRGWPNWKTCPSCSCSEAGGICYNPDSAPLTCDDLIDMKCIGNGKRDCKCCINCETTTECMTANGECRPMGACEDGEIADSTIPCGTGSSCTCCVVAPAQCTLTASCIKTNGTCDGIITEPLCSCGDGFSACCITASLGSK